jgi:prepilin-type N-terminal cleavage/methylation domain-containing protein
MTICSNSAYAILLHMKGWLHTTLPKNWRQAQLSGEGYTLVEVMIVLAVSGSLIVSVAILFSGRIAATQFRQALSTYEANIQDTISDTANGFFNNSNINCSVNAGGNYIISNAASSPGANKGCVFAGKMMIPDNLNGTGNIDSTAVTTLVAKQFRAGSDTVPAASIVESEPEVLAATVGSAQVDIVNVHDWELRIERMRSLAPGNDDLNAFGFMIPVSGGVQEVITTSSSGVLLYGHLGVVGSAGRDAIAAQISSFTNFLPLPSGMIICFSDAGDTDRTASMRIGENNSQTGIITAIATSVAARDPLCA